MSYVGDVNCPTMMPMSQVKEAPMKFVSTNVVEMSEYALGYLISGTSIARGGMDLSIGNNYWLDSGILCDEEKSDVRCIGKTKKTYIRNIPTGTVPGVNMSFAQLTGTNLPGVTEMRGVLGGMVEDLADISPPPVIRGVLGEGNYGSSVCKRITLPVGKRIYDPKEEGRMWKWKTECSASYNNTIPTTDTALNGTIATYNDSIVAKKGFLGLGDDTGMGIPAGLGYPVKTETYSNGKDLDKKPRIVFLLVCLFTFLLFFYLRLKNIYILVLLAILSIIVLLCR